MTARLSKLKTNSVAALVLLVVAPLTGCRKEEIQVYRVPREEPRVAQALAGAAMPEQVRWETPAGWKERDADGIRAARLVVAGKDGQAAEISVIPMPGVSAGKMDIVNIWRDQVRLGPVSEADLADMTEKVQIGAEPGELFDLVSNEPLIDNKAKARILVAMVKRGGTTWFFKLTGDEALVREQKPAFLSFLKSVSFVPGAPTAVHPPVAAGGNAGQTAGSPAANSEESGSKPAWDVPAGWQEVPPSQMLLAKFLINGNDGKADVTVSVFPGDVGGVLANVNRWRGQIGLEPVDQSESDKLVSSLDVMGGKAMLVDMSGQKGGQKTRLVGVIVPRGAQTWFYKLMGDPAVAEREKPALIKFVQSVRYSNA